MWNRLNILISTLFLDMHPKYQEISLLPLLYPFFFFCRFIFWLLPLCCSHSFFLFATWGALHTVFATHSPLPVDSEREREREREASVLFGRSGCFSSLITGHWECCSDQTLAALSLTVWTWKKYLYAPTLEFEHSSGGHSVSCLFTSRNLCYSTGPLCVSILMHLMPNALSEAS